MKKAVLMISIYMVLLAGCNSSSLPTSPPSENPTTQVTTEVTKTPILTRTVTATEPLTTTRLPTQTTIITSPPDTPTPITLPLHSIERRCAVMENPLPTGFLADGAIFLEKEAYPKGMLYVLHPKDMIRQELPDLPDGFLFETSPDWKWLAYRSSDDWLLILGPSGEIRVSSPWDQRWKGIQSWLDSERLILTHQEKEPVAVDVFNPFTGERETLDPGLEDVYRFSIEEPGRFSTYVWKLVYDQILTRLVYLRDKSDQSDFPFSMVMVDLDTDQTLWEFDNPQGADLYMPVWSPDGMDLLFVSIGISTLELFTVNREGQAVQWIDIEGILGIYDEWRWSPNNRYIAFHADTLFVLDTKTRQFFDLCIPWQEGSGEFIDGIFPSLFWSPDSSQLIFQRLDAPAVVVDLASGLAAPLLEDISLRPVGWLKTEP